MTVEAEMGVLCLQAKDAKDAKDTKDAKDAKDTKDCWWTAGTRRKEGPSFKLSEGMIALLTLELHSSVSTSVR